MPPLAATLKITPEQYLAAEMDAPTRSEYVLVDPRTYRVDVFRRTPQNRWELINFESADAEVEFASIHFHCPLQDIYDGVDFELT
ncbi:hypothetical protein VSS37_13080 [Candidatus Thiothrix sp. Deng01]|uniref:Restriction endonuclease domain-containing protein n=1 Tax=Candidatus Thiothrix phosphatis TaxID=3112415 RepID=A0ABU6D0M5_9GAMM|nr:hypothetical protein [Candidatus Thiothrix sp. Deng01]MEB4591919.1 hypothetical protein [Candidatus Thiothrix sp. Deng01]